MDPRSSPGWTSEPLRRGYCPIVQWVPARHGDWVVAAVCAALAGAFLWPHWSWVAAAVPLTLIAVLVSRRQPLVAAWSLVATALVQQAQGIPLENATGLAALLPIVYALGRSATGWRGGLPLAALVAITVMRDEQSGAASGAFLTALLSVIWTAGRLVRVRTERAESAAATALMLSSTEPRAAAARAVAQERARIAGEALAVVRETVTAMRVLAEPADPDKAALEEIQARGRAAVVELRRLLGLLRSEAPRSSSRPELGPAHQSSSPPRMVGWPDTAAAGLVGVLALVEALSRSGSEGVPLVLLGVLASASLVVRRAWPGPAALVACLAAGAGLVLDLPWAQTVDASVVTMLLAWSVAADGSVVGYAALGLLATLLLPAIHRDGQGNEAMFAALVLLGAVPGHLWGEQGRAERSALREAHRLRGRHAAVTEEAVRGERLRLARELHDVVSHAIGVMVLQAAAAHAQRDRDPAAATAAVGEVRAAADRAIAEVRALDGLLSAGTVGDRDLGAGQPVTDLRAAVADVVDRMSAAGLRVSLMMPDAMTLPPHVAATAYRVVQEAMTNAARHAPGSAVEVTLVRDGALLTVRVRDHGPSASTGDSGFGLVGLDERLRALGGELSAGRLSDGGFEVSARLPLRIVSGATA